MTDNYKKPCLFLDRDGVINLDFGYVHKISQTQYCAKIGSLLKIARENNFLIIVITNQAGIAKGFFSETIFIKYMDWLKKDLINKFGNTFDEYFFCPHHIKGKISKYKKNCNCRKPKTGMFEKAIKKNNIDVSKSIMIGDQISDIEAAYKVNIKNRFLYSMESFESKIPFSRIETLDNKILFDLFK